MAAPLTPLRLSLSTLRILRQTTTARHFTQVATATAHASSSPRTPTSARPSLPSHPPTTTTTTSNSPTPHLRHLHTTPGRARQRRTPLAHNREPVPAQAPPTDLGQLDVLGAAPVPTTAGRRLPRRRLLPQLGRAHPWRGRRPACGGGGVRLAAVVDLLILGLGPEIRPLSPATRRAISNLGMRVEVLDTRNAASQYNMLATERGVEDVAAALIPIGWKEGAQ
ncbi:hypothetical protein CHGG_05556 [Chaetomium globosum CBS 148.51]|uniref:NADH dehydrogenase [ubiquinone] 1 alpha subcomplex assembly factor 3 n=1 Tax=Chaetomium globosum (strain ATCC 6205 / CBS 148.51 / DSM 1962 / NBRC 6347 / NRRL 1970) TaxID=306901 RepID=Q2H709_CHAGB|nr:uncharacterized protein CHGG_05556 [Chaetomium globosum CBS 148.51]EAQ88937.1 hypothetical protein CHGG_05556 [Chaetomium globosum CBS 148.51]